METHNPVVWFEIYTNDLERAKIFYETVFQIQLAVLPTPEGMPLKMLTLPNNMDSKNMASGALVYMEGFEQVAIVPSFIFIVKTALLKKPE